MSDYEIFKNGSTWLRADFHLHTNADKEFKFTGDENYYISQYVDSLKNADIRVGVIANHNKFDKEEFNNLRKNAKKAEIFLLPGVELSVNDGANGIHTIIVFNDAWLESGSDYINQFLNVTFEGKTPEQYEHENGRSSHGLIETIKKLEGYNRDFFIIFAHVEQSSGLWAELEGGRLTELGSNEIFKRRTLGFQKVKTHDVADKTCRVKVQSWLKPWYPAEVEGSDCKSLEDIGNGKKGFIKLGDYSFDAVKFALVDYKNRINTEIKDYHHSYLKSIRFEGGTLSGTEVNLSPELNTMIGIRGSGKSSILEVIRYVLDIPFGDKAGDMEYKQKLIGFTLGSGGKVIITATDRYGQVYEIRRIWKENSSSVYVDGLLQPGVSIRETIIKKPIYFGQKDLSATGEGFEKDLVEKLLGSKLDEIRTKIETQKAVVSETCDRLLKTANIKDMLDEQIAIKQDTEYRLEFYQQHGIEEKLQKRLDFDADIRNLKKGADLANDFLLGLQELLARHEDEIRNFTGYSSKHNPELFERFAKDYAKIIDAINQLKEVLNKTQQTKQSLFDKHSELITIRNGLSEEFAEIERKLAEELKSGSTKNISSDEFLNLKKKLFSATQMLDVLTKQREQKKYHESALVQEIDKLNQLHHEEFLLIKGELDKVGQNSGALTILSAYKEDRQSVINFVKDICKGSGIKEATLQNISLKYLDFIAVYKDIENSKTNFGSNPQIFLDIFMKNLKSFLTYQAPNKFTINYRNKELQHHSLGQRASALMLFVLSQKENDVIIIDQPEDDLDNQTIYEDVIKMIRQMKHSVQFIFATHNPNIPVLGDAELVHACSFMDNKVTVQSGSVDDSKIQNTIVNIMEGGLEAFNRRKEIYQIWKP